jgi:hypothetical protein
MKSKTRKYITQIVSFAVLALMTGCLFEEVNQPKSAQLGETIDVNLVITSNIIPEPNPHKGLVGIIAPIDWEFISANYTSPIGNGALAVSETWKDSIQKYYPIDDFGSNMKWIVLISDSGYSYQNVTSFNVDLKLKVGQTEGCFELGYLATKADAGLVSSGNNSWVSISFPNRIGVPDSNLCTNLFETRKAQEWDDLFDRQSGWTGADGIYTIPLDEYEASSNTPAGKQLILFSDTFIGEVDSLNRRQNARLINNTLALMQSGNPDPNETEFFWREDSLGDPETVFIPNTPNANEGDWYWLMDGIALDDTIYVFALRLNSSGGGGVFGFELNGVALLKFTLDPENFISAVEQFDTPLFFDNQADNSQLALGQAVMSMTSNSGNPNPDGYIYIYGPISKQTGKDLAAARVLPEHIEDFDQWQYWNGSSWGSNVEECAPIVGGISQEFSVSPFGDGKYILVYQAGASVLVRLGDSPTGPFGIYYSIYDCPEVIGEPDIFVYNAKAHPNVSSKDELLISYNVNSFDFGALFSNADIYRPRFIYMKTGDSTTTDLFEDSKPVENFQLNQNYPNPFNPTTKIEFSLAGNAPVNVKLKVYDVLGKEIQTLVNDKKSPGHHSVIFDGKKLASGIYFYKLSVGEFSFSKKMILLK